MSHLKQPLRDHEIRTSLRRTILPRYTRTDDAIIIDEFNLRHGETRIDIAVINGLMHGFEIKSDRDTLARLPLQAKTYGGIFDRVTLVVGERHLDHALRMIPDWWGIKVVALGARGAIKFESVRRPLNNFEFDSFAIASLLWRNEAWSLLNEFREARHLKSRSRAALYTRLVDVVEPNVLRARVRTILKARSSWRAGAWSERDDG